MRINNNTFDLFDTHAVDLNGPVKRYGIECGRIMAGYQKNILIQGNRFFSTPQPHKNHNALAYGIAVDNSWTATYEDARIIDNEFDYMGEGIHMRNMIGTSEISQNLFTLVEKGLYFYDNNLGATITCNTFNICLSDLWIDGTLANQSPGYDLGNTFSNSFGSFSNITNMGSAVFTYDNYAPGNNVPTVLGNVVLNSVTKVVSCEKDTHGDNGSGQAGKGRETITPVVSSVKIYPNPAKDWLNFEIQDLEVDQISIFSLDGKLVLDRIDLINSEGIDISSLAAGSYAVVFKKDTQRVDQKILIVEP